MSCSFNIEALALELVTETAPIAPALAEFLLASAREIAVPVERSVWRPPAGATP